MAKVAIVDKYDSKVDYKKYFEFDFIVHHLCESNVKRVLKKDITLEFDPEEYDYVILVGADACKHIAKISSVTKYQGYLVEDKFLPITNPAMLAFKPEGSNAFNKAVDNIHHYIDGEIKDADVSVYMIQDEDEFIALLQYHLSAGTNLFSMDSETSALYARDGYVLGISLSFDGKSGYYVSSDCITEDAVELLQTLINRSKVVFHNAKFDISFFSYHFGLTFKDIEDTMLMHYTLDERVGTHGLKELTIAYTDLGDYDRELEEFKANYCKQHGIRVSDFTYDLIPFEIIGKYAAIDAVATLQLYFFFKDTVYNSENLKKAYTNLLIAGTIFLYKVESNGVPFDRDRLLEAQQQLSEKIATIQKQFYEYDEIHRLEKHLGKVFNPNSVQQLRVLLYDMLNLPEPSKRTATGNLSTDAEVLKELSNYHDIPKLILEYKKSLKIKSTYIDKVLAGLDRDGRLRTYFNLATTSSGRLSSSGKLNMQQLPRDDKTVKYCIKAREGYVIISQDLATAEMYVVAVLSGDKKLQKVFVSGGDFHSSIAHMVFKLDCKVEDVKKLYPDMRQAAKAISFGILYGSGPAKVAETVGCSLEEAKGHIAQYFNTFDKLKRWLSTQQKFIKDNGFTYSFFGRKRRLPNVFSKDSQISSHEVRSGVNALVQGPASDINLLAGIDMQKYIEENGMKSRIFGLVHDSILAEVPINEIDTYTEALAKFTQKDRGLSIPGSPIGIDVEIGFDYSFKEKFNVV